MYLENRRDENPPSIDRLRESAVVALLEAPVERQPVGGAIEKIGIAEICIIRYRGVVIRLACLEIIAQNALRHKRVRNLNLFLLTLMSPYLENVLTAICIVPYVSGNWKR